MINRTCHYLLSERHHQRRKEESHGQRCSSCHHPIIRQSLNRMHCQVCGTLQLGWPLLAGSKGDIKAAQAVDSKYMLHCATGYIHRLGEGEGGREKREPHHQEGPRH